MSNKRFKIRKGSTRGGPEKYPALIMSALISGKQLCSDTSENLNAMRIPYKIQQIDQCLEILKVKDTRRYKCKYCDNDYANPSGRRRHEKQAHSNIPEVQPGASSQSDKIKAGLQRAKTVSD